MKKKQSAQKQKGKKGGKAMFDARKFALHGVTKEAEEYVEDVKLLRKNFKLA